MNLNNVMWRKLQDGCPGVSLALSPLYRLQRLHPGLDTGAVDPQISTAETQAG